MKIIMDSNGKQFAEQIRQDFSRWQSGVGDAVGSLMVTGLERAASEGFAPGQPRDPRTYRYQEGPGFDLTNKQGRKVFKAGKVVDRSHLLPPVLQGVTVSLVSHGDVIAIGRNAAGTHLTVTDHGGTVTAEIEITKLEKAFIGFEYGNGGQAQKRVTIDGAKVPDLKPGQRRVIKRAFSETLILWRKALKGKLDKWIDKCGDK